MFCPNCGAQVTGSFCPNCGTQVAGSGAAGPQAGYSPPPVGAAGLQDNLASALCYLAGLVTGIIFLVIAPYNRNRTVRFHAFQSIFGHIAVIILWIVYIIVGGLIGAITHGVGFFLFPLFGLLVFVLWLYMMYSAYQGRKVKLPIVGDLAEGQA